MEVSGSENRVGTVFLYEMLGTALFVYCILLTNNPISISFSLFASILLFGAITGGHFNPAVTLGVYISEAKWRQNLSWLGLVVMAQVFGGFIAMGLTDLTLFKDGLGNIAPGAVAKLCPQNPLNDEWPTTSVCDGVEVGESGEGFHSDLQVLTNESILTAVFVSVILMVKGGKTTSPTADGIAGPLAIVLTLLACARTGGKLGGCFNPAVGLVVTTFSTMHLEDVNNSLCHYMYAFVLGPLIGGALAGAFNLIHRRAFQPKGQSEYSDDQEYNKAQKSV
jgi:aquaporin Z